MANKGMLNSLLLKKMMENYMEIKDSGDNRILEHLQNFQFLIVKKNKV